LNRNSTTRANQDGPEIYGFRGNGRNYDLNRDFIKSDTRNTKVLRNSFTNSTPMFYRQPCKQWCGLSIQTNVYHDTTEPIGTVLGTYLDTEMMPSIVDLQKKILKLRLRKCF
jgi:hypothetical protein